MKKYLLSFSLFRHNRNFLWLYMGQFVSMFGNMITFVALPYQIYHLTQSTLMVGMLGLCQLIPLLFTALLGGVLADHYPRRPLLLMAEGFLSIGTLLLMLNALLPSPHLWLIFVTATLMSAMTGLHRPALESSVQQIVEKKDFAEVSALNSLKYSIGMIGGSSLAGVILATLGLTVTFFIDFLTFAFSLICLYRLQIPRLAKKSTKIAPLKSLKEGCKYALSRQELMGSYWVDFIAMIFGMPMALIPALVEHMHASSMVLGLFYAAPAVGSLFLSFVSQWVKNVKRHGMAIALSAGIWGVTIIGFGLSHNLWLSLFFFMLSGAADGVSGMFRSLLWNETIPEDLRGRLAGIEMISYLSGPRLGDAESGLVAAYFGLEFSIVSGGLLCILGVAACCYFLPKFWKYRSTSGT